MNSLLKEHFCEPFLAGMAIASLVCGFVFVVYVVLKFVERIVPLLERVL